MDRLAPAIDNSSLRSRDLALAALGALLPGPEAATPAPAEARFLHEAWARSGGD